MFKKFVLVFLSIGLSLFLCEAITPFVGETVAGGLFVISFASTAISLLQVGVTLKPASQETKSQGMATLQIGTLVTGAGQVTNIPGQTQSENYILIGDVATTLPIQGLQVEVDGVPTINIPSPNQVLIQALAKYLSEFAGTVVGQVLKIGTGRIKKTTTYRFTNAGATTPAIFAYSDADDGVPMLAGVKTINPSSYDDFEKFTALFIPVPANIGSAEIIFNDGYRSTLSANELDSLFNLKNQTDANGRLQGCTVIDNKDQSIRSLRLNIITAQTTVLVFKVPNAAWGDFMDQAREFNGM